MSKWRTGRNDCDEPRRAVPEPLEWCQLCDKDKLRAENAWLRDRIHELEAESICTADLTDRPSEEEHVLIDETGDVIRWVIAETEVAKLNAENVRLREALEKIKDWANAYPLDVFPEPDMKEVAQVLKNANLTIGSVSASNMRHCLKGAKRIARAALDPSNPTPPFNESLGDA